MTQDEIIRMAVKCQLLNASNREGLYAQAIERFAALVAAHEREALAKQAQQEPVAWVYPTEEQIMAQTGYVDMNHDDFRDFYLVVNLCKQLNSAPVRTKDLTDVDLWKLWEKSDSTVEFARAVIAADREKNK